MSICFIELYLSFNEEIQNKAEDSMTIHYKILQKFLNLSKFTCVYIKPYLLLMVAGIWGYHTLQDPGLRLIIKSDSILRRTRYSYQPLDCYIFI